MTRPARTPRPAVGRSLLALLVLVAVTARPAQASDYSGFAAILLGIPTLVVTDAVLGVLLTFRASKRQRVWAAVLAAPVLLAGAALMPDAATLLDEEGAELGFGVGYFALYALAVFLAGRLVLRAPGAPAPDRPEPRTRAEAEPGA